MKFSAHGHFELRVVDNIIIIDGSGYGNCEAVEQYKREALPLKKQLAATGKPWGNILHLQGNAILVKEAVANVNASAKLTNSMGLTHVGIVLDNVDFEMLVRDCWTKIYHGTGIDIAFFYDEASALAWVREGINS